MDIGYELRERRKKKKITQEELADILGWPPSKVSKIESGKQEILYIEYLEFENALQAKKIDEFTWDDFQRPARLLQTN